MAGEQGLEKWLPHRWECQAHRAGSQLPGESRRQLAWPHAWGVFIPLHTYSGMQRQGGTGERKSRKKRNDLFGGKKVHVSGLAPEGTTLRAHRSDGFLGPHWSGETSCSFASHRVGPRGRAKEEPSERQDWEAKIRWERDWQ